MPTNVLVTDRYVPPGVYIGRVQTPAPTGTGQMRLPCMIGRGNRLQTIFDTGLRRSRRVGVQLTFTTSAPYLASLGANVALNDKSQARLYKQNAMGVPLNRWQFAESVPGSGIYDLVLIDPQVFDSTAKYYIDYQSTNRNLLDTLPFANLREVVMVGDVQGQNRYVEGRDFILPMTMTGFANGTNNATGNQTSRFTSVTKAGGGTGTLTAPAGTSVYTGAVTREYVVEVVSVAAPNVTFRWTAAAKSGQAVDVALPNVPLAVGGQGVTITVDVTAGAPFSLTDPTAGDDFGVEITPSVVPANFSPGATYTFSAIAPQEIVFDPTIDNTNQYPEIGAIDPTVNGATTGSLAINRDSAFTGLSNRKYVFTVTAIVTGPPKTATLAWQGYGEGVVTSGTFTLNNGTASSLTRVPVELGLYLDGAFGSGNFTVGDRFDMTVLAPRTLPSAKDDREITLTVASASAGVVGITYLSSTPEGRAGNLAATYANGGRVVLPGGVVLYVRNIGSTSGEIDYAVGDTFDGTMVLDGTIDWSRTTRVTETLATSSVLTDNIGLVTGVPGARYTVLQQAPVAQTYVERFRVPSGASSFTVANPGITGPSGAPNIQVADGVTPLTRVTGIPSAGQYSVVPSTGVVAVNVVGATELVATYTGCAVVNVVLNSTRASVPYRVTLDSAGNPTPNVLFTSSPPATLFQVTYDYRGIEPDPGNFYYLTVNILRPADQYNEPLTSYDADSFARLVGPAASDNDIYIAGLAAFDNGSPGVMVVQVADANGDGAFSPTDYQLAIRGSEQSSLLTDVIVLNGYSVLSDQLSSNERMNDPFQRKDRGLWVGVPTGTMVGNADTPDTLVFLSRRTMAVYGDNPAHGMRVLLAPTAVTRNLVLSDGSTVSLNLDGSFFAAATAGLNASFQDPGTTLLRRNITGFTSVQTYGEAEQSILGANGVLFVQDVGSNVYRFGESITTDQSAPSTSEISVSLNQWQYVVRTLRADLDTALIGTVPNTRAEGEAAVRAATASILANLVGRNIIGPYVDEAGVARPLDPNSDIEVFRSENDPTLYFVRAWFCARYPMKRLQGLISIDRRFWSAVAA